MGEPNNRLIQAIVGLSLVLVFVGCGQGRVEKPVQAEDWTARKMEIDFQDSLVRGQSYLSVYSKIYSQTEHQTHDLTVTVSLRNTGLDTATVTSAKYYNTHGDLIRTYFDFPVRLKPMETVEIIIAEADDDGGTGGNFIFDWVMKQNGTEPLFEAVMISTSGQQGLSFRTDGVRIK